MSSNKTAYTYYINPNGSGETSGHGQNASKVSKSFSEANSVHQTSPSWVLTFLRWEIRDTLRTNPTTGLDYTTVSVPLVVENDCVQISVADSKSVLTPSMTATLLVTDINYETAIAPGDFVFVNMLNWESDARRVANNARDLKPINGFNDGFKGFFKVQSVRKALVVDPQTGTKTYTVKVTGFAFTEFNNSIYFNPHLITNADNNYDLYLSNISQAWDNLQTNKGLTRIQDIVQFLITHFVGTGFPDDNRKTNSISPISANTQFYMPKGVDDLLGLPEVEAAKDTYNYLFGIQQYSAQAATIAQGMNPSGISPDITKKTRFIILPNAVEGSTVQKAEYWNQQKAWSILNQFSNSPLNELYSCFRISPTGSILPTIVFRQIPFTNDDFVAGNFNVTRFMSLPRWSISPALAFNFDLGKDEALRLNFMQFYGVSVNSPIKDHDISVETSQGNYVYDADDVKRNGLRPSVITSEFDTISKDENASYRSPGWAKIMGDALIGGHLKMSGSITFVGIVEPIPVGDNLEFDGVVYHIEQISHNAYINQEGHKTFRTTFTLSNGLDITSGTNGGKNVRYSEMKYGSGYDKRSSDYNYTQILPGVSESQNTFYRPQNNPDQPVSESQSFTEPNTNTSINKTKRDS